MRGHRLQANEAPSEPSKENGKFWKDHKRLEKWSEKGQVLGSSRNIRRQGRAAPPLTVLSDSSMGKRFIPKKD